MEFIYIDLSKDGTGGFALPKNGCSEELAIELLKDPKYVRRGEHGNNGLQERQGMCPIFITDELLQDYKLWGLNFYKNKETP